MTRIYSGRDLSKPRVIYALVDGLGNPVYVGQTMKKLSLRLSQHLSQARNGPWSRELDSWLRDHPEVGIVPLEVHPDDPDEAERKWIAQMRNGGLILFNLTIGGRKGGNGNGPRPRHIVEKTASALRGRARSAEFRAKLSAAHKGVPLSAEHRAAIGRGTKNVPRTPEWNQALSDAKKGDKNPMSAAQRAARATRQEEAA